MDNNWPPSKRYEKKEQALQEEADAKASYRKFLSEADTSKAKSAIKDAKPKGYKRWLTESGNQISDGVLTELDYDYVTADDLTAMEYIEGVNENEDPREQKRKKMEFLKKNMR